MIIHYLKIAFRNLFKYKTQSVISVLGLAVGFTCFALSAIWIHYEMTYDTFHEDAGQIHIIRKKDDGSLTQNGISNYTPYLLAQYLKDNFSEVKAACATQIGYYAEDYYFNDQPHKLHDLRIDSTAFSVFDIRILEGSNEFLTLKSNKIAYPNANIILTNIEEQYNKFLTSENALLRMLTILSIVCILISVFGIYSQIVLTCEQRRKEIAIRKVNGAHMKDILAMFAKEYAMLLVIASVIAFSIGYAIMKHWLESYTLQTPVSWWIFACIFIGIAIVIALSIGYRVWKAANENPAKVVKSE